MKKNIWMVLAAASLMTACDYNEKYFEGFDETDQSNVQKYTCLLYTSDAADD